LDALLWLLMTIFVLLKTTQSPLNTHTKQR
jgi:hypothetical protein